MKTLALCLGCLCLGLYAGSRIEAGLHPPVTVLHAECHTVTRIPYQCPHTYPCNLPLTVAKECQFTDDAGHPMTVRVVGGYAIPEPAK